MKTRIRKKYKQGPKAEISKPAYRSQHDLRKHKTKNKKGRKTSTGDQAIPMRLYIP